MFPLVFPAADQMSGMDRLKFRSFDLTAFFSDWAAVKKGTAAR
jgi:hypothetical protein